MKPEFTIALATYNGEKYLEELLESLLALEGPSFEIVIRDDLSKDSTPNILTKYTQENPEIIRLIRSDKNLGFKKNFEELLKHTRGRYIALADQDDRWFPNKLERLSEVFEESTVSLIHSNAQLIGSSGEEVGKTLSEEMNKEKLLPWKAYIMGNNNLTGCTVSFRRELLEKVLPIPEMCEYHDCWLGAVASRFGGIAYVGECLIEYRLHNENQIGLGNNSSNSKMNELETLKKYTIELLNRKREMWTVEQKSFLEIYLSYILLKQKKYFVLQGFRFKYTHAKHQWYKLSTLQRVYYFLGAMIGNLTLRKP